MCGLVCTNCGRHPISLYCNAYCCSMQRQFQHAVLIALQKALRCLNYGYEVGGVDVAVNVAVGVDVAVDVIVAVTVGV